jgi:diguanylate cyclase (GGDEF)-like protein/PAS domain S-box-containing protein
MSPQVTAMLGFRPQEWIADPDLWPSRLHPNDRARVLAQSDRANATGQPFLQEYRLIARDGREVWIRDEAVPIRDPDGTIHRWHGVMGDITERKHAEEQMVFLAYHDAVTGLPNRHMFEEALDAAIREAQPRGSAVAVLYMDLDDFKTVNDTLGHDAGDEFLREVGRRIQGAVRERDLVARQGGDEFLVLLTDLSGWAGPDGSVQAEDVARAISARIREVLEPQVSLAGLPFVPSASIGVALFPSSATDGRSLLVEADAAMYRSKRAGPGGVALATGDGAWPVHRGSLASQLRRAVEDRSWAVHYQPIVDLRTGEVEGMEALVRWRDETGSLVPPSGFLRVAEETGLLEAVDDWVLTEALRQMATWSAAGVTPGFVSVNLAAERCRGPDPAPGILERIGEAGIDPSLLMIELADTPLLVERGPHRTVEGLRAGGVRVAVDDFGSGSSSLVMLREVRVDMLKIDRPFVCDAAINEDAGRMLEALISLARRLDVEPIVEGVETEAQRSFASDAGSRMGQGFLFGRPLPAAGSTRLLERSHR